MFGTKQREHDERYKVAAEWISLIKQLWTLDGFFDFEGEFFAAKDCYAEPKPVQDPHPIVMSAGHSDAGRRFAMTHADLLFAATSDPETTPDLVKEIKKTAAQEYNRDLPVYGMASIVCRDTEDDAKRYFEYYVKEKGDRDAAGNMLFLEMLMEAGHTPKAVVIANTEKYLSPDGIFASNTSTILITRLAEKSIQPEKFVGIHFFSPVHKMKLVEIVAGEKTSKETIDRAKRFVISIGKLPVVVKDSPGFLVNRILLPYLIEAIRLFASGHSIKSIDSAMTSFGMPMGPLRLLDEIGLDVASHVALSLINI